MYLTNQIASFDYVYSKFKVVNFNCLYVKSQFTYYIIIYKHYYNIHVRNYIKLSACT